MKVVSFKTSDENYSRLKDIGKSFREVLEPLLSKYLENPPQEKEYTGGIPTYSLDKYNEVRRFIESLERG